MNKYKCLNRQEFSDQEFRIVPIRYEDRFAIMRWRNEQIYHLRQQEPLTEENQELYFQEVVSKLFEEDKPNQILFSYLRDGECIGYGGLVHINWTDRNAEVSFIIDTRLETTEFKMHWAIYLNLLEKAAFNELRLNKIYTYAFDLRPHLYEAIEAAGFNQEAILSNHCLFNGKFIDVIIHSKFNTKYTFKNFIDLSIDEARLVLNWRNHDNVRKWMYNTSNIGLDDHLSFIKTLNNSEDKYYFMVLRHGHPLGVFNLIDYQNNEGEFGFYLSPDFHDSNLGIEFYFSVIEYCFDVLKAEKLVGYALVTNKGANSFNSLFGFDSEEVWKENYSLPFLKRVLYKDVWENQIRHSVRIKKILQLTNK